jgi:hypothetical protein
MGILKQVCQCEGGLLVTDVWLAGRDALPANIYEWQLLALLGSGAPRVWRPLTVPKRTLTNRLSAWFEFTP